jgi:hypothetical protein
MKRTFCLVASLLVAPVFAGQSAEMVCTRTSFMFNFGEGAPGGIFGQNSFGSLLQANSDDCVEQALQVTVTADDDAGRPGAFGVGAQLSDGSLFVWTESGGWAAPAGGIEAPADGYYDALPVRRTYTIWRGPFGSAPVSMCALSNGRDITLWAGHGSLTADAEYLVKTLHELRSPGLDPDHIRAVYIQMDATRGAGKGGPVYTIQCRN